MEIIVSMDATQGIENYNALIAWVREKTDMFKGVVVEENAISAAKADIADLRRIAKTASDLRISIKKEHEAKIEKTISQLKEITEMLNGAADSVNAQVTAYADGKSQEKYARIQTHYDEVFGKLFETIGDYSDKVPLDKVINPKWKNATCAEKDVCAELDESAKKVRNDHRIITAMALSPEMTASMLDAYYVKLDMSAALDQKNRLEEQAERVRLAKQAQEALAAEKKPEPIPVVVETTPMTYVAPMTEDEEKPQQIDFRVWVTTEQKAKLRAFFIESGIKYGKVE